MPYDSMAAWSRSEFEFSDEIQQRGASWSGQFSFDYGPGSTISRDDYKHPSPPKSPSSEEPQSPPPRFTDKQLTCSPPPSPRASPPPPSPRVDSAISWSHDKISPGPAKELPIRSQTRLANRLYSAACSGDLENLRFLLNLGAPVNTPTIVRDLYDSFKPPKPGLLSALAGAAGNSQLDACELLISEGATINTTMKQSSSAPIHQACKANDLDIVRLLLEQGADVNAQNCYKTTPLMYSVKYGTPALVELLLSYKSDLSLTSFMATQAIHWATWPGSVESIKLLLKAGADPNAKMGDGGTPLHCAAQCGFGELCRVLLDRGADAGVRNLDWRTPGDLAEVEGYVEAAEMLREAQRKGGRRVSRGRGLS